MLSRESPLLILYILSLQEVSTSQVTCVTMCTVPFMAECTCRYCTPVEYVTLFGV